MKYVRHHTKVIQNYDIKNFTASRKETFLCIKRKDLFRHSMQISAAVSGNDIFW